MQTQLKIYEEKEQLKIDFEKQKAKNKEHKRLEKQLSSMDKEIAIYEYMFRPFRVTEIIRQVVSICIGISGALAVTSNEKIFCIIITLLLLIILGLTYIQIIKKPKVK